MILDIQAEFTKQIYDQIARREHSTRQDKERLFGEMAIYEDALRILYQVIAFKSNYLGEDD